MINQIRYLGDDLRRWSWSSFRSIFYNVFEQGVWVVVFYRLSRVLFLVKIPLIKVVLRLIAFFLMKFSEFFLGAVIKPEADIGPGLYVGHAGCIIVHQEVKAGKNLNIGPGVIIGQKGLGAEGVPQLGDNVYVGTGAKLLGNIHIGNDVRIGANAVVLKDIPDGATVVGVPAQIIKGGSI